MALRIDKSIVKCEIDNRLKDYVMGKIWFVDQEEPVCLSLKGNCLRDIAGSRIILENSNPEAGQPTDMIALLQEGKAGDMTASRKVQVINGPVEEAYRIRKAGGEIPLRTANCIYLEWFSESNGRVVVESTDFKVSEFSEPKWRMSREEEKGQIALNQRTIGEYIARVSEERERVREEPDDYKPMDEFEWEKGLKESDMLTDKYSELLELYMDHPDRDKIVAREMGWTWLDDALDADERGVFDEEDRLDIDDMEPLEPNPMTEGRDWIRTNDGRVKHPLSYRAFETAMDMWHYCHDLGIAGNEGDTDLQDMLFEAQVLGAKLAGALDSLAYDHQPEGGFVVACLKRALQFFEKSIAASEKVRAKGILEDEEKLEKFRSDLFEIREEMLNLMKFYRSQQI